MKRILTTWVLCVVIATSLRAEQAVTSVTASARQISISLFAQPHAAEAKLRPFLEGRLRSGKRERFGVQFGGAGSTATVVEILGTGNTVLKTISLSEFLGTGPRGSVTIARPTSVLNGRRLETVDDVPLSSGKAQLVLRGTVTGDADGKSAGQQLILSFALRAPASMSAGIRLTLPVSGNVESHPGGVSVTLKGAALAMSLPPARGTAAVQKNKVVITSPIVQIGSDREKPVLWLVTNAFASANASAEAARWLKESAPGSGEPRVVIVSSANKQATLPGDTVTYTLVCTNIGTGDATGVTMKNPIPTGTRYVEDSATTNGFTVSYSRSDVAMPQRGEVKEIVWTSAQAIAPGEESLVHFKIIVR